MHLELKFLTHNVLNIKILIKAVLASFLLLRSALRSETEVLCAGSAQHPAVGSILAVMVGRLGGWGVPVSGSYRVLLQNVFCSLLSLLLFLLPLQWYQLALWLVPLRESSVCISLLTSLMWPPSPPPKTHLAVLVSLHKPSVAVASGKKANVSMAPSALCTWVIVSYFSFIALHYLGLPATP